MDRKSRILKICVEYVPLHGVRGTIIRPYISLSSKVPLTIVILHTVVLSNLGIGHLFSRLRFVLNFITNKLCSIFSLTSAFGQRLIGLSISYMYKIS